VIGEAGLVKVEPLLTKCLARQYVPPDLNSVGLDLVTRIWPIRSLSLVLSRWSQLLVYRLPLFAPTTLDPVLVSLLQNSVVDFFPPTTKYIVTIT
jgi:hypothetical protein